MCASFGPRRKLRRAPTTREVIVKDELSGVRARYACARSDASDIFGVKRVPVPLPVCGARE